METTYRHTAVYIAVYCRGNKIIQFRSSPCLLIASFTHPILSHLNAIAASCHMFDLLLRAQTEGRLAFSAIFSDSIPHVHINIALTVFQMMTTLLVHHLIQLI